MSSNLDQLFLTISDILDYRVTPENMLIKLQQVESIKGITNKDRTRIITAILSYLVANDK